MKKILSILILSVMLMTTMGMVSATGYCGNGYCGSGETCSNCPQDCGICHYLDIKEVKLNGLDQVTVAPSASITASVETETLNEDWKSTKYQIQGGSWMCVDTPNHDGFGTNTHIESFGITAPSSVGTYDFTVKVYEHENCDDLGDSAILQDGIIVVQQQSCLNCQITISTPKEEEYYRDSVLIDWTVSGTGCPSSWEVYYGHWDEQTGCSLTPEQWGSGHLGTVYDTQFNWDLTQFDDDKLCVRVEGACCNSDVVGPFYVDDTNPTAEANGPYSCDEGISIPLSAQGSHDVGLYPSDSLSYAWDFDGDGQYDDATGITPSYFCADGTKDVTVSVKVTDDVGNFGIDNANVHILNVLPVADAHGPYTGTEGNSVSFTGSGSDVAGDLPLTYAWDFGDGGTSPLQNPTHTYADDGTYTVTLTVSDGDGGVDTDTTIATIDNLPPETPLEAVHYDCDEGETITLDASATDVIADPLTFAWDFDGDLDYNDAFGPSVLYTCGNGDQYLPNTVTVKITDDDGGSALDNADITINNVPPIANADGPYITAVGEVVCFTGSATDVFDTIFTYEWDIDYDGETFNVDLSGSNPCTTYSLAGIKTVALRAKDDFDYSPVVTTTVTVYDYAIHLKGGWNLISIPLVPEDDDTDLSSVFDSIKDDVSVVWAYTYDPIQKKNVWTYHVVTDGEFDDEASLQMVVPGYGYYVKMIEDTVLYLNGEIDYQVGGENNDPVIGMPPMVTLAMDSWNLVGVYGTDDLPISYALVSLTDEENNNYYEVIYNEDGQSPFNLESTEGYWLSIKKAFAGKDTIEYKANYKEDIVV